MEVFLAQITAGEASNETTNRREAPELRLGDLIKIWLNYSNVLLDAKWLYRAICVNVLCSYVLIIAPQVWLSSHVIVCK